MLASLCSPWLTSEICFQDLISWFNISVRIIFCESRLCILIVYCTVAVLTSFWNSCVDNFIIKSLSWRRRIWQNVLNLIPWQSLQIWILQNPWKCLSYLWPAIICPVVDHSLNALTGDWTEINTSWNQRPKNVIIFWIIAENCKCYRTVPYTWKEKQFDRDK